MLRILSFALVFGTVTAQEPPLEQLNIDQDAISVSGFSSGGSMASQVHVAHSSLFMGAAVLAGIPYTCLEMNAVMDCADFPETINMTEIHIATEQYANEGEIDNLGNMEDDQVWVYTGALDSEILPGAATKVFEFYKEYSNNVLLENTLEAEHIFPTDIFSNNVCNETRRPYIGYCEYDSPFVLLNYIYGGQLVQPERTDPDVPPPGELRLYDQTEFVEGDSSEHGFGDSGYIYVPSNCQSGEIECRLHIVLHGCDMTSEIIGDTFVTTSGYNEVAKLNNIVIIFPQTARIVRNPVGCWDIWGYTGENYVTKSAVQISALARMVDRIAGTNSSP